MANADQNIPWFKETEKYTDGKQLAEQSSKEKSWPWPVATRHASSMLRSPHPVFCFNWTHCTEAGSMFLMQFQQVSSYFQQITVTELL